MGVLSGRRGDDRVVERLVSLRPLGIVGVVSGGRLANGASGWLCPQPAGRENVEVVILYPKGLVSPRQEKQLTCWGASVRAYAVRGDFDDC